MRPCWRTRWGKRLRRRNRGECRAIEPASTRRRSESQVLPVGLLKIRPVTAGVDVVGGDLGSSTCPGNDARRARGGRVASASWPVCSIRPSASVDDRASTADKTVRAGANMPGCSTGDEPAGPREARSSAAGAWRSDDARAAGADQQPRGCRLVTGWGGGICSISQAWWLDAVSMPTDKDRERRGSSGPSRLSFPSTASFTSSRTSRSTRSPPPPI